jgi:WD40 repeat protein
MDRTGDDGYVYDAFASYATDPDGDLVRALEATVEGFHLRPGLSQEMRHELELCVDGRDFSVPRRGRDRGFEAVSDIVISYMQRSRALLVLTGPLSRKHPWIDKEIEWWITNRGESPIYFALTHGPSSDPKDIYPPALLARGGGDLPIFFDLRGFYLHRPLALIASWFSRGRAAELSKSLATGWRSVRRFDEEAARVAARLLADERGGELSLDDIEAAWHEQDRRARRNTTIVGAVALLAALGAGAAIWRSTDLAVEAQTSAKAQSWIQHARSLVDQGGAAVPNALAYAGSALVTKPSAEANAVALAGAETLVPIRKLFKLDQGEPTWTAEAVPDENIALVGGRSGILRALDVTEGQVLWHSDLRSSAIRTIIYDPPSSTIIVGTDRGLVRLRWKGREDRDGPQEVSRALPATRIGGLVLDASRRRVIVGALLNGDLLSFPLDQKSDDQAAQWKGERLNRIMDPRFVEDGSSDVPSGIYGMRLTSDRLVVVGIDGVVSLFAAGALRDAPRQFVHPQAVFAVTVSHNGRELVLADENGGVSVYDLNTTKLARASQGTTSSASVGRSLHGSFAIGSTDKLANVGLALDTDDGILAVTSHDRTVRFMSFADLAPIGTAVHGSTARSVLFVGHGRRALTFADDGSIQLVEPAAQPEISRLAEIDGFAAGEGELVAWPMLPKAKAGYSDAKREKASVEIFSVPRDGSEAKLLGTIDEEPWSGTVMDGVAALRPAASTKVYLTGMPGHATGCKVLQHANEGREVAVVRQVRPGPEKGTVATLAERQNVDPKSFVVNIWRLSDCAVLRSWDTTGPFATAANAVATVPNARLLEVRSPSTVVVRTLSFEREIEHVSISANASTVLVTLRNPSGVCVCAKNNAARAVHSAACNVQSADYSCRAADVPETPTTVELSPSGDFAVAQARSALQLLGGKALGWSFKEVSPVQLRQVTPPFAFSPDEKLLAVPAGETGARIVDPASSRLVSELPTPSRVLGLAFVGADRLATLDGNVLRIWDVGPSAVKKLVCERWNPQLAVETAPGVPAPLSRREICESESRAQ